MSLFKKRKKKRNHFEEPSLLYKAFENKDTVQLNVIVDGEVLTEVYCPIIELTNDGVTFKTPGLRFYFPEDVYVEVIVPDFHNKRLVKEHYDFERVLTFEDAEGYLEVK